ncbi:MAG TPA: hypothetical protein PL070_20250, partial [Flavobacteriales bacterium]|nr:hypothetical protein [Flavobacteriales bacterium]
DARTVEKKVMSMYTDPNRIRADIPGTVEGNPVFIYHDIGRQTWLEGVDSVYQVSGGHLYQVTDLPNGNRATKYFCGLALLQAPFFAVGHAVAGVT